MDYQSILEEVETWPVDERLRLADEIWRRTPGEREDSELSDAWKAELLLRIDEMDSNPDAGIPWEVIRAETLKRLRP
ncbi:addiction module protein [Isosphaeraceae bacterium EP7]